jgi:hypothetical protein
MSSNRPCIAKGCPFAHSLDEFIIPFSISSSLTKREYIEKVMGILIEPFMLQPSSINHVEDQDTDDEKE